MTAENLRDTVLQELRQSLSNISQEDICRIAGQITKDRRIFCDAAGRSRLQIEGFAMRLIQMGFVSKIVGEPTTPAVEPADILLICSASGETPSLVAHARKAKAMGVKILLITANAASSLAQTADECVVLNASSKQSRSEASVQPMGSLFEQSIGIFLDIIVLYIMETYHISSEDMYQNHANLE